MPWITSLPLIGDSVSTMSGGSSGSTVIVLTSTVELPARSKASACTSTGTAPLGAKSTGIVNELNTPTGTRGGAGDLRCGDDLSVEAELYAIDGDVVGGGGLQ